MSSLTLAQKKKFVKEQLKAATDKVVKAIEVMPETWTDVELQAYIARQFQNPQVDYELRGNTVRGKAFNAEVASNPGL
jgi:hypothetical protein